jgi:hypothetical protein
MKFSMPAFGAPRNSEIRARTIEPAAALASGTASWARIYDGNRNAVLDIDVGIMGATLTVSTTQFEEGAVVVIDEFVVRSPPLG